MKHVTLVIMAALLAAATTAHAGWWRTYGGADWEIARCIQITSEGNYIISGERDEDVWLIKTDTSGDVIWEHVYEANCDDPISKWLEETSDGGYIVASRKPSLLKVNAQGDSVWAFDYGMYSYCAQETSDNGYIVVGGDFGYGQDDHLILIKTNSMGDTSWTKIYGNLEKNWSTGFFIQQTIDGGYIITGRHGIESEEYSSQALWLVKTDFLGDTLWTKEYGTWNEGERNSGFCVRQTSDSGYVVVGHRDFGQRGLWLLKTDKFGDTLWTKTYSIASHGEGYCIQETDDGFIMCGSTEAWVSSYASSGKDLWLLKTDKSGDSIWTRYYGGEESDMGFCVQQCKDSGYIVVGYTLSFGSGSADIYFLKTDSLGLLGITDDRPSQNKDNWNIVSAFGRNITMQYNDSPQGFHAEIFDALGRKVDEIYSRESSGSITWGANHVPGVYFIQAMDNQNQLKTAKAVLVR